MRDAASTELSGRYCAVTASGSVAALYSRFIGVALSSDFANSDTAALKDARPRRLNQAVAAWIAGALEDGPRAGGRHRDGSQN